LKDVERVHLCLKSKLTVDFKVKALENEIFNLQQDKVRSNQLFDHLKNRLKELQNAN
jgi:hypothetical protein